MTKPAPQEITIEVRVDTTREPEVYHIESDITRLDCILHPDFKEYTHQLHLAFDYIVNSYPVIEDGGTVVVGYTDTPLIHIDPENGIVYIGFTDKNPAVFEANTRAYNAVFGAIVDGEALEPNCDACDEDSSIWDEKGIPSGYRH